MSDGYMGRLSDFINGGGFGFSVDESVISLNVKNIESMMTDNPELREKLREAIRQDVKQRFDITIHPEVNIV